MKKYLLIASSLIFIYILFSSIAVFFNPIQQSHLEEHLPETFEKFQIILDRDLQIYFSKSLNKNIKVKYELLRREPTQSGLSYPKFYAWVNIYEDDNLINEGAVRIVAVDKIKIDVSHFFSKKDILENSISLETFFPLILCDVIKKKANNSK